MEKIQKYFEECINFWMKAYKLSREAAMVRVIWWDCAETWNSDKSWDNDKVEFINRYRNYKPYDPIPDERLVEEGNC